MLTRQEIQPRPLPVCYNLNVHCSTTVKGHKKTLQVRRRTHKQAQISSMEVLGR